MVPTFQNKKKKYYETTLSPHSINMYFHIYLNAQNY